MLKDVIKYGGTESLYVQYQKSKEGPNCTALYLKENKFSYIFDIRTDNNNVQATPHDLLFF